MHPGPSDPSSEASSESSSHRLSRRHFLTTTALGTSALPVSLVAQEAAITPKSNPDPAPAPRVAPGGPSRSYESLNRDTWRTIIEDKGEGYRPPLSTHLPIQSVHNSDFVHVDSALNVCRRRVSPNLSVADHEGRKAALDAQTFIVQFALEAAPFVPDMNASQLSLEEGRFPVVHANYFSNDLLYKFTYFCSPLGENTQQSVLWIGVDVINESIAKQKAHVRAKVNFQKESDLFDYHYIPFYWDATRWLACDKVQLQDNTLLFESRPVGKVVSGEWTLEWEAQAEFPEKAFLHVGPYRTFPSQRLYSVQDTLHLSTDLESGENRRFWIALLVDAEGATDGDYEHLVVAKPEEDRTKALRLFQSHLKAPDPLRVVDSGVTYPCQRAAIVRR